MKNLLFTLFILFPTLAFAHDGHMTASGPFHYLEHSAILFAVIMVVFAIKKVFLDRTKK